MSAIRIPEVSRSCSDDLFHSAAWFEVLVTHGLVVPVRRYCLQQSTVAGPVQLHLMDAQEGYGLTSLSNYYSGLYGPLGDASALAHWSALEMAILVRQTRCSAVLRLHPLDADAPWLGQLETGLQQAGYWTDRHFCFGNWFQPVPPSGFADYWAMRPSALRNTVARARKRLEKGAKGWRLDILTCPGKSLEAAIEAYVAVYNQSWKTPEPRSEFMPSLIRMASEQGWLRLGVVYVGAEPVAAQVWLVAGGKANIFKLAYVKGQEKLSAGSVLTAELMRHVMDVDQVKEVDFLSGDDPYKADWMGHRRERIGLVAFDKHHWRGWLAAARHELGKWRQSWRSGR